jgi:asparagine synthase (glutamine-hydrolysing)
MTTARFLALVWTSASDKRPAAIAVARRALHEHRLTTIIDKPGLLLLADSEHVLLTPIGAIVGSVFSRQSIGTLAAPASPDQIRSVRQLIDECWGRYVAFLSSEMGAIEAVRDPSGSLPCYRYSGEDLTLFASDIEFLIPDASHTPQLDWHCVEQLIGFPHLRGQRTGLAGIDEVLPGCRVVVRENSARMDCLWSPWTFTSPALRITDFHEASAGLRKEILQSVLAVSQEHDRILLELSGGLDSSILAAALSDTAAETVGLNLATEDAEGDERRYARLMAARAKISLIERRALDLDQIDLGRPARRRLPRPGAQAWLQAWEHHFVETARTEGCSAFVSGTGGDNVFCSLFSGAPAADLLRTGRWLRFPGAVRDLATIHDTTLWRVGALAVKSWLRRSPTAMWPSDISFLRMPDPLGQPDYQPWLEAPTDILPGSRAHVRSIIATYGHQGGSARDEIAPSITPLLAQPVQEWCLRVPSWLWVRGGRDRSVARHAFEDLLPEEIAERRSKGSVDSYCLQLYERQRAMLREMLVEGQLVAGGILDPDALRNYFDQPRPARDISYFRVLSLVDVEIWARDWLGSSSGRSAAPA